MTKVEKLYEEVCGKICEEMKLSEDIKKYLHEEINVKTCIEDSFDELNEAKESIKNITEYQKEIINLPDESKLKKLLERGNNSMNEFLALYEDLATEKSAIEREIGELTGELDPALLELYRKVLEESISQNQRKKILDSMSAYKAKCERRKKELEENPELKKKLEELTHKKEALERELNCVGMVIDFPAKIVNCVVSAIGASYSIKMEMGGGACTYGKNIRYSGLIESIKDENKLRTALGAEIGHKIAEYFIEKDDLCVSVNEFYDILGAYCSGSPYSTDVIKENAILGELSFSGVDITSEDKVKKILDKKFEENQERYKILIEDAKDYKLRHGMPGHQEGAALYVRLVKVFGNDLPKIAGDALKNPEGIDFSSPVNFYRTIIQKYYKNI